MRLAAARPAFLALAVALVGCGDNSDGSPSAPARPRADLTRLTGYLPAATKQVAVFDARQARVELGLPADADVLAAGNPDPAAAPSKLALSALPAVPALIPRLVMFRAADPLSKALDGRAISSAAATVGVTSGLVGATATTQSFTDLAALLVKAGWKRAGTVVAAPASQDFGTTPVAQVADAGRGVLLFGGRDADLPALIATPPGGPVAALALIAGADRSTRFAATGGRSCVTVAGGWASAAGDVGVFRLGLDRDPDPDKIATKGLATRGVRVGAPRVDGHTIDLPFRAGGTPLAGGGPVSGAFETGALSSAYSCG